ncbi:hypothetical protein J3458_005190 [Metarhizium acridum]|uniref:uncharacterized protein n=1 Tax=Metarhizium acridum TaxID=92637 RepID=UPI001C6AC642|nr:hypothetical protein J3458_005190 [Metarhizium acridum]
MSATAPLSVMHHHPQASPPPQRHVSPPCSVLSLSRYDQQWAQASKYIVAPRFSRLVLRAPYSIQLAQWNSSNEAEETKYCQPAQSNNRKTLISTSPCLK